MKTVACFSAGVSSAVAIKLCHDIDVVLYTHIEDQHPDTLRFIEDCQAWFDLPVQVLQSPLKSVENACLSRAYVNGVHGAPCTELLKRRVRKTWEREQAESLRYVWGLDATEPKRAERIVSGMPQHEHLFPLIAAGIDKTEAHKILHASGIKRPAMYDLGYHNNNCIGCVKAGMGYWNKIRVDFPEIFASRAAMERRIGGTCIKGVYLDVLDPKRGRHKPAIVEDCGIFCELRALGEV